MSGRPSHERAPFSVGVAALVVTCYGVAGSAAALVPGLDHAGRTLAVGTLLGSLAGVAAWLAAPRLAAPAPPALPAPPAPVHPETQRLADRIRFDRQLDRALEAADDRPAMLEVVARALDTIPPGAPAELLLLGPRQQQLLQAVHVGPDGDGPGCPVGCPAGCVAMRTNRTVHFGSSDDLDACRHLGERDVAGAAATCVPVRMLGRPVGVLHRLDPTAGAAAGTPEQARELATGYLESLAGKVEARLAVLRLRGDDAFHDEEAEPDGIGTRRALERQIEACARSLTAYALGRCEIDHFETYVREHGDTAADDALRTLGRAAQRCMRPADVLGRGGGDALLALFPATRAADAGRALERIREELALELTAGVVPPFTVAAGVVQAGLGLPLDAVLEQVAGATARAAQLGGNRVVLAGEEPTTA